MIPQVNICLFCFFLDVTLTYEITGRPEATRPIPGETVVFFCETDGSVLTWRNERFSNPTYSFVLGAPHVVGSQLGDGNTGVLTRVYSMNVIHYHNSLSF